MRLDDDATAAIRAALLGIDEKTQRSPTRVVVYDGKRESVVGLYEKVHTTDFRNKLVVMLLRTIVARVTQNRLDLPNM